MEAAFLNGNCDALAGDLTRLANTRASFGNRANEYLIVPELISTDPLAAAYLSIDRDLGLDVRFQ